MQQVYVECVQTIARHLLLCLKAVLHLLFRMCLVLNLLFKVLALYLSYFEQNQTQLIMFKLLNWQVKDKISQFYYMFIQNVPTKFYTPQKVYLFPGSFVGYNSNWKGCLVIQFCFAYSMKGVHLIFKLHARVQHNDSHTF